MTDQPTLRWLRNRAYTVLAELMTSDDDRVALRAAQTVIDLLDKQDDNDKEQRFEPVRTADRAIDRAACWAVRNPQQSGPVSRGGLRTPLGQDRSGEDRGD